MSIRHQGNLQKCEMCGRLYNTFVNQGCPRCAVHTDS